jgi:hypothetical protein
MNFLQIAGLVTWVSLCVLYAWKEGSKKRIGFTGALLIMIILTPFFGYFIIESLANKNAKGCKWCGNKRNEAEYCGLCGKNDEGITRPGFKN